MWLVPLRNWGLHLCLKKKIIHDTWRWWCEEDFIEGEGTTEKGIETTETDLAVGKIGLNSEYRKSMWELTAKVQGGGVVDKELLRGVKKEIQLSKF